MIKITQYTKYKSNSQLELFNFINQSIKLYTHIIIVYQHFNTSESDTLY